MQWDLEIGSPLSWVGEQVLRFFIASGRSMFWCEDFDVNRCSLGRSQGFSPWIITIFREHIDLPQFFLQDKTLETLGS
jgi:hypothetical protein